MSRVLLIDDDRWLCDSYRRVLERAGHEVVSAANAQEAVQLIDMQLPDVCVVDMLLEGHTAMGLLHELQSYTDTQSLPVIVCSGLSLSTETLHQYGVVRVLDKQSLTPKQLVDCVEECAA